MENKEEKNLRQRSLDDLVYDGTIAKSFQYDSFWNGEAYIVEDTTTNNKYVVLQNEFTRRQCYIPLEIYMENQRVKHTLKLKEAFDLSYNHLTESEKIKFNSIKLRLTDFAI